VRFLLGRVLGDSLDWLRRMRRSQHTDQEIAFLLQEAASGTAIATICATAHVSIGTFYRWRRRFGGLSPAGVTRLGDIERENARLRSEVISLRQALLASASAGRERGSPPRATPMPGSAGPATGFRGGHASVGRYAGLRTAT
jgi:putative transposase